MWLCALLLLNASHRDLSVLLSLDGRFDNNSFCVYYLEAFAQTYVISSPFWREYYLPLKPKQDILKGKRPLSSVRFSRMCVFLLSRFSLVAVNKAFYCGVVSAIADTVSVQGVPVPGPNPQTNSKEGQGQPLPLLSLGIKAEERYLTLKLYSSRLHVSGFILHREI